MLEKQLFGGLYLYYIVTHLMIPQIYLGTPWSWYKDVSEACKGKKILIA